MRSRAPLALLAAVVACRSPIPEEVLRQVAAERPAPGPERFVERDARVGVVESATVVLPDGRRVKDGPEIAWWPNGAKRAERRFAAGRPVGVWRTFWPDGTLRSEYSFDPEGRPTEMRFWHENGVLAARGAARDGLREGRWTFWWPNGNRREEGSYLANRREGEWTFWRPDGTLEARGLYRDGRRVGTWEHGPGAVEAPGEDERP